MAASRETEAQVEGGPGEGEARGGEAHYGATQCKVKLNQNHGVGGGGVLLI